MTTSIVMGLCIPCDGCPERRSYLLSTTMENPMKSIALTLSLLTGAPALAGVGLANDGITGCNYPTIAAAVANAAPNDTVWIGPGTYQENLGSVYKDLVISASGPSCGSPAQGGVTIDAGSSARFMSVGSNNMQTPAATIELHNVLVVGGSASAGGSIYVADSSHLTMRGVTLRGGHATSKGGCLRVYKGTADLYDVDIQQCVSDDDGGGIAVNAGAVRLFGTTVGGFLATNQAGNKGGGVALEGGSELEAWGTSAIQANSAEYGGGISATGGSAVYLYEHSVLGGSWEGNTASEDGGGAWVHSSLFSVQGDVEIAYNRAEGDGGAIAMRSGSGSDTLAVSAGTVFEFNESVWHGAAIHAENTSDMYLTGVEFYANNAGYHGAVLQITDGDVTIINTDMVGNSAHAAPGIEALGDASVELVNVRVIDSAGPGALNMRDNSALIMTAEFESCTPATLPAGTHCSEISRTTANATNYISGLALHDSASATVKHTAFLDNIGGYKSSAVFGYPDAAVTIANSLFVGNRTLNDSGYVIDAHNLVLKDSTITGNDHAGVNLNDDGVMRRSIVWKNVGKSDLSGAQVVVTCSDVHKYKGSIGPSNISLNPQLTATYGLGLGSPAIDACSAGPALDMVGNERPVGLLWDMGAFERQ